MRCGKKSVTCTGDMWATWWEFRGTAPVNVCCSYCTPPFNSTARSKDWSTLREAHRQLTVSSGHLTVSSRSADGQLTVSSRSAHVISRSAHGQLTVSSHSAHVISRSAHGQLTVRDQAGVFRPKALAALECSLFCFHKCKQDSQCTYNVTFKRVRETTVVVEKQ